MHCVRHAPAPAPHRASRPTSRSGLAAPARPKATGRPTSLGTARAPTSERKPAATAPATRPLAPAGRTPWTTRATALGAALALPTTQQAARAKHRTLKGSTRGPPLATMRRAARTASSASRRLVRGNSTLCGLAPRTPSPKGRPKGTGVRSVTTTPWGALISTGDTASACAGTTGPPAALTGPAKGATAAPPTPNATATTDGTSRTPTSSSTSCRDSQRAVSLVGVAQRGNVP